MKRLLSYGVISLALLVSAINVSAIVYPGSSSAPGIRGGLGLGAESTEAPGEEYETTEAGQAPILAAGRVGVVRTPSGSAVLRGRGLAIRPGTAYEPIVEEGE